MTSTDQPPEDAPLSEDLARLNDWQAALSAMGQPAPCEDEAVEGPTDDITEPYELGQQKPRSTP